MTTPEELKRQIEEKMQQAIDARQKFDAAESRRREKFRAYKQQHKQLQQAHRLLVLEHRDLKGKYIRACDAVMDLDGQLHELVQSRSHFPTED